jgi:hypothetical protein
METLWIERERYSGETARLIDRLIIESSAPEGKACLGSEILIRAMAHLAVPLFSNWGWPVSEKATPAYLERIAEYRRGCPSSVPEDL